MKGSESGSTEQQHAEELFLERIEGCKMGPKGQGKRKVIVDSKYVGNGVTSAGGVVIEEGVDKISEVGEEGRRLIGQAYYELVDDNVGAI